jgi:hypothetical protein
VEVDDEGVEVVGPGEVEAVEVYKLPVCSVMNLA